MIAPTSPLTRTTTATALARGLAWLATLSLSQLAYNAPAAADDGIISEVRAGVLAHNVPILGEQKEHGVDLIGELLFVSPVPADAVAGIAPQWGWLLQPRPTGGFEANMNGYTSQLYVSLTWTINLDNGGVLWPDHAVFLSVSFGPAYNTGHVRSRAGNRLSLGANLLFHPAVELGVRLSPVVSVSAYLDHSSNASLANSNAM